MSLRKKNGHGTHHCVVAFGLNRIVLDKRKALVEVVLSGRNMPKQKQQLSSPPAPLVLDYSDRSVRASVSLWCLNHVTRFFSVRKCACRTTSCGACGGTMNHAGCNFFCYALCLQCVCPINSHTHPPHLSFNYYLTAPRAFSAHTRFITATFPMFDFFCARGSRSSLHLRDSTFSISSTFETSLCPLPDFRATCSVTGPNCLKVASHTLAPCVS